MVEGLAELEQEARIEVAAAHGNGRPITTDERLWLISAFREVGMLRQALVAQFCGETYGDNCDQCAAMRDAMANPDPVVEA